MKVKCINNARTVLLKEGRIYNVLELRKDIGMILVEVYKNKSVWHTMGRFCPVEE